MTPHLSRWVCLAVLFGAFPALAAEPETDEQRLQKHLGGSDGPRLLSYLKSQVLTDATTAQLRKWIDQMGDKKFALRQEASKKLVELGLPALPWLREAMGSNDREIAQRARRCVAEIESGPMFDLPGAAVRHLVALRHEKAVEALLAYYPAASNEALQGEVLKGLATVGVSGQQIHPLLLAALDDPVAARRSLAVQALLQAQDKSLRPKLRAKLKDADATVRFHAAVGLVNTGDRDAVTVLIDSIKDTPHAGLWQHAEEILYTLAGDLAPHPEVGEAKAADRNRISEHWAQWWQARGGQILLGQKEDRPNDAAIIADTQGKVFDWRPDAPPRFEIKGLVNPVDARLLSGNRLIVAQERNNCVQELDFRGKVIWEKIFDEGPVSVQRLSNGNTFVALHSRVVEVRRDGEIVASVHIIDDGQISDANKFPDGRMVCLCNSGELLFFNAAGKRVLSKQMGGYGGVDWLPSGNILISYIGTGKVQEVTPEGKTVWEHKLPRGWVGTRTPDGHTLIASRDEQKMYKIDAKGKVVWEKPIDGHPHAMHWK